MKLIRVSILLALFGAILSLASCSKKETPHPTVKFSTTDATYSESDGTINIPVSMTAASSQEVTVNYTWVSPDSTAFQGGDFSFDTPSSITIRAGSTAANIQIEAIDDAQIDGDNNVTLTITGTSTNASVTTTTSAKTFNLTITDNDVVPNDQLQIDLYWFAGTPTDDINNADLDLFLQDSVSYTSSGGSITVTDPGLTYTASAEASGFETIFLDASAPDSVYFITVGYAGGSGNVTYLLGLNGLGRDHDYLGNTFSSSDAPVGGQESLNFWGPFQVNDGVFDFLSRSRNPPRIKGKTLIKEAKNVLRVKLSDFKNLRKK